MIAKMSHLNVSFISRDERDFPGFRQKVGKELLFYRGLHQEAKKY